MNRLGSHLAVGLTVAGVLGSSGCGVLRNLNPCRSCCTAPAVAVTAPAVQCAPCQAGVAVQGPMMPAPAFGVPQPVPGQAPGVIVTPQPGMVVPPGAIQVP